MATRCRWKDSTHLIPHAAGHEVIRQGRKHLSLIRMTPDLIYDQLIGMGCADRLVFSWGGNPGVGSLHRLRDAIENGWPHKLEIEEHSHAAMANACEAGAAGCRSRCCAAISARSSEVQSENQHHHLPLHRRAPSDRPAHRPDVAIIHALKADRKGNVLLEDILGVQKEVVLAANAPS